MPARAMAAQEVQVALAEQARDDLAFRKMSWFVRRLWPVLEPGTDLIWNWHLDVICDALQEQAEGHPAYRKLLICVPPGSMKSLLVSVFAPAWDWLHRPWTTRLFLAASKDLVIRDSQRTRDILKSDEYHRLMTHALRTRGVPLWDFAEDQDEKANFSNTRRGNRYCVSLGSRFTGRRAGGVSIDDPIDIADVLGSNDQILARIQAVNDILDKKVPSRVNNLGRATWTLIMQRTHEQDPAAKAYAEGDYKVICLPLHFNPDHPWRCPEDQRTTRGQSLSDELYPPAEVAKLQRKLGPSDFSAQYEQWPTSATGGIYQLPWFGQRYVATPEDQAGACDDVAIFVDATFKGDDTSDFCALQVWGRKGRSAFFLLDRVKKRMGYVALRAEVLRLRAKWPSVRSIVIEDAANGSALVDELSKTIPGVVGVHPPSNLSKIERAQLYGVPVWEGGSCFLPNGAFWLDEYIAEHTSFGPRCANDDEVDATVLMAMRWGGLRSGWVSTEEEATAPSTADGWLRRWPTLSAPEPRFGVGVFPSWCAGSRWGAVVVVQEHHGIVAVGESNNGGMDRFSSRVVSLLSAIHTPFRLVVWDAPGVPGEELCRRLVVPFGSWRDERGRLLRYGPAKSGALAAVASTEEAWSLLRTEIQTGRLHCHDGALLGALQGIEDDGSGMPSMSAAREDGLAAAMCAASWALSKLPRLQDRSNVRDLYLKQRKVAGGRTDWFAV